VSTVLRLQGVNKDVDAGTEDIWDGGGAYTGQPTGSAEALNVVSGSTADAPAGTGARTLRVEGLDSTGAYVEETVTLNGTTPVVTSSTWLRVLRAFILTAGTGGTNAGAITVKHNVTTANIFTVIEAGRGQMSAAAVTVPVSRTGKITSWGGQVYGLSATAAGEGMMRLKVRPTGSNAAWRVLRELVVPAVPTTKIKDEIAGDGLAIAALSDVKVEFISATANSFVLADIDISW
jgi:hypothetical protein